MKNVKDICREVASKVKTEMLDALEFGYNSIVVEVEYGSAWVQAELDIARVNGWVIPTTEVTVFHEYNEHQSPRLEKAIMNALPSWDDVEREYEQQMEFCR